MKEFSPPEVTAVKIRRAPNVVKSTSRRGRVFNRNTCRKDYTLSFGNRQVPFWKEMLKTGHGTAVIKCEIAKAFVASRPCTHYKESQNDGTGI